MSKDLEKASGTGVEEDFTTSMARLAELAAQGIIEKKSAVEAEDADSDLMREFLTPKKKAKQPKSWSQMIIGKTIKVRINPYVASGILVVLVSIGVIAAPRVAKYLEQRNAEIERKRIEAVKLASQTEVKLKKYTVFDAAKDAGNGKELKSMSVAELALKVQEANIRAESRRKATGAVDLLNDGEIGTVAFGMQIDDSAIQIEDLDPDQEVSSDTTLDSAGLAALLEDTNSWDSPDVITDEFAEFRFDSFCQPPLDVADSLSSELFYADVLRSLEVSTSAELLTPACRG